MAGIAGAGALRVLLLGSVGSDGIEVGVASGTSQPVDVANYQNLVFYLKTHGSPGAGTCILETADWNPNLEQPSSLTWSAIQTVTITSGVGNSAQTAVVSAPNAYHFVRARIGTTVTTATLAVVLCAN